MESVNCLEKSACSHSSNRFNRLCHKHSKMPHRACFNPRKNLRSSRSSHYRWQKSDHPHHQQQTQQTFHVQLLRLAYPAATNVEADAQRVASTQARTGGRSGGGASCVTPNSRSSHGLFRGTIAEKDPRFFGPARGGGLLRDLAVGQRFLQFGDASVGDIGADALEFVQVGKPFEMYQSCVVDLGAVERQLLQVVLCFVVHQPSDCHSHCKKRITTTRDETGVANQQFVLKSVWNKLHALAEKLKSSPIMKSRWSV